METRNPKPAEKDRSKEEGIVRGKAGIDMQGTRPKGPRRNYLMGFCQKDIRGGLDNGAVRLPTRIIPAAV
jgi:hypothetical protein